MGTDKRSDIVENVEKVESSADMTISMQSLFGKHFGFKKLKQAHTTQPSNFIPWYLHKRYESVCPHYVLFAYFHSNITYNRHKLEAIQMFIH